MAKISRSRDLSWMGMACAFLYAAICSNTSIRCKKRSNIWSSTVSILFLSSEISILLPLQNDIKQYNGGDRLHHRHRAVRNARVMPPLDGQFCRLPAGKAHRLLGDADGRRRLDRRAQDERHPIADPAQDPSAVIASRDNRFALRRCKRDHYARTRACVRWQSPRQTPRLLQPVYRTALRQNGFPCRQTWASPGPAGRPTAAHSITPPTESASPAAAKMAFCIRAPFPSSMTGKAFFRDLNKQLRRRQQRKGAVLLSRYGKKVRAHKDLPPRQDLFSRSPRRCIAARSGGRKKCPSAPHIRRAAPFHIGGIIRMGRAGFVRQIPIVGGFHILVFYDGAEGAAAGPVIDKPGKKHRNVPFRCGGWKADSPPACGGPRKRFISSKSICSPAGKPSMFTPIALPWDCPKTATLSRVPNSDDMDLSPHLDIVREKSGV